MEEPTRAEMQVLQRLARGMTQQAIANDLGKTIGTIKTQVSSLIKRLGADSATGAVGYAYRNGILPSAASDAVLEQNIQLKRTVQGMRRKTSELEAKLAQQAKEIADLHARVGELLKINQQLGHKANWLDSTQGQL